MLQFLDTGINLCSLHQRTMDVAVFITMLGCFAVVIFYVIRYIQYN